MPNPCPCQSGRPYSACCGPIHAGEAAAQTAEALMRSRYSAYVLKRVDYIKDSLWPKYQAGFDAVGTTDFANAVLWTGLRIIATEDGEAADKKGTVTFEARYLRDSKPELIREKSLFRKKGDRWYYVEALPE